MINIIIPEQNKWNQEQRKLNLFGINEDYNPEKLRF
jgi:hypothetical protein